MKVLRVLHSDLFVVRFRIKTSLQISVLILRLTINEV